MEAMNKEEFLSQLERLLGSISPEERADAMAYYRSYFEDAGIENEASILEELESPQKVAQSILKDAWSENSAFVKRQEQMKGSYGNEYAQRNRQKNKNAAQAVGIAAIILLSPLWGTILLVIVSVMLGLICALFGVLLAVVAVIGAVLVSGGALVITGIGTTASGGVAAGIGVAGVGFLALAAGILSVIAMAWVCGVFIPWAYKGILGGCKNLWNRRKGKKLL